MAFLKSIPNPEFKILPRNALIRICDQLEIVDCIRGSTIFQQDEPFNYIYFITEGEFQQTIKVSYKNATKSMDPIEMLKITK